MDFRAPSREQIFVLKHIAKIGELAEHERFANASEDMVEAIVEGIGQFAMGEFAPLNRTGDTVGAQWKDGAVTMPDGFRKAYDEFVAGGWASIDGPEEFDGQGLPYSLSALILETCGAANFAFTLCPMLSFGAVEAIHAHGSDEQKARYLPNLISGAWTGTMNLTEPQAGSDVGALRATAEPVTDGPHAGKYRIKGQKIYITFGEHDLTENIIHLVLARTPGAPEGTRGISLFIVPKNHLDADGNVAEPNDVTCVSIEHKLGIHASPTCVMAYGEKDECYGEMIGGEFGGMKAMFTMMNNARINVGSQGVQISERATQQAIGYATERVQSARAGSGSKDPVAIIEHPDVRRMLLRSRSLTQATRALLYYATSHVDRATLGLEGAKARAEILTPLIKGYGTDVGNEVASIGVQVHGGMGFVEETGAAQHFRDARIAPIYEGTNGIQAADLVGRKLGLDGGEAMNSLLAEIKLSAGDEPALSALAQAVEDVAIWMSGGEASIDDRLAGSYPFMTMLATATCGMLMKQQHEIARSEPGDGSDPFLQAKLVTTRYYLDHLVPEAMGLKPAAMSGADILYALDSDALSA
ncbi:Acyl-CoA dehydrogenase [Parasphingorhabdus marina DSM 22363]|uniref:3-methylmercaptopropionyl-CoA dehydrogenase n=1 Tax=Parasphingorhabdus marina DSM 22363 TaxID=1123272 RepID=A0A1N6CTS3_9SPHN|nr:acyl-CoA dehydrogenase [Parasphingorhabdus marina]SIN62028.1 Acyl-CoA dehydrogenase [Parasphingorhabdus marina DSM 22363]